MTDYTRLSEALLKCAVIGDCTGCGYADRCWELSKEAAYAIDDLMRDRKRLSDSLGVANHQGQSLWISVEDKLPPDNVNVLCLGVKGGVFVGYCYHPYRVGDRLGDPRETMWCARGRYCPVVVKWMPIPADGGDS